jgi:hypothetical protein
VAFVFPLTQVQVDTTRKVSLPERVRGNGQAKEHFKAQPERVIYLADSQERHRRSTRSHISIDRTSDRSIVQASRSLFSNP